ncbi:MAG TPA: fructose-bisphosphatase class II, partial [Candidatus Methylomirabilis sp.]|nr:fructose-bisphosphatase class II [Candidatus Methylomirabilis sp.]
KDVDRIYRIGDLAKSGDVMFAATGVTDGDLLRGVRFFGGGARTHSVVMRYRSGTVRFIEATHRFDRKPVY